MNSKLKNSDTDFLFKAILSLENEEECYRFFEDLCTSPELKAMSQRLVVAKMLTEKKVYSEIVKRNGCVNRNNQSCKACSFLITIPTVTHLYSTKSPKRKTNELQYFCRLL